MKIFGFETLRGLRIFNPCTNRLNTPKPLRHKKQICLGQNSWEQKSAQICEIYNCLKFCVLSDLERKQIRKHPIFLNEIKSSPQKTIINLTWIHNRKKVRISCVVNIRKRFKFAATQASSVVFTISIKAKTSCTISNFYLEKTWKAGK